VVERAALEMR